MIAAVSMVRNEADIIEAFIRHTLTFADILLIVDHNSTDNTLNIINLLQKEGLPIAVTSYHHSAQLQAEVLSHLMEVAFQHGYSLVIPLDADEFLFTRDKRGMREYLLNLSSDGIYSVSSYTYRNTDMEDCFSLKRHCYGVSAPDGMDKVMIGVHAYQSAQLTLMQGSHKVQYLHRGGQVKEQHLDQVYIAHFAYRSLEQMKSKFIVGWLGNVSKYSVYTNIAMHWKEKFYAFLKNGEFGPYMSELFSPKTLPLPYEQQLLTYVDLAEVSFLKNLLYAAEKQAMENCKLQFLLERQIITIIIIFTGDVEKFINSFTSAIQNKYPYKEYIIAVFPNVIKNKIEQLYEYLSKQDNAMTIYLLLDDSMENLFSNIRETTNGVYVQWLISGDEIQHDKLCEQSTAMNRNRDTNILFRINCYKTPNNDRIETLFYADGRELLSYFDKGLCDKFMLCDLLFHRSDMERWNYLQEFFKNGEFYSLDCYSKIFKESTVLITT